MTTPSELMPADVMPAALTAYTVEYNVVPATKMHASNNRLTSRERGRRRVYSSNVTSMVLVTTVRSKRCC